MLAASGQIPDEALGNYEFLGELALGGTLRPVNGVLPACLRARDQGRTLVVPRENAAEAALVDGADVRVADNLLQVCAHLQGGNALERALADGVCTPLAAACLSDVRGQHRAKRALEVAASGGHSLLFVGPPGAGKSMLASRLPGILPPMTQDEALQTAAVVSVGGNGVDPARWRQRPYRAPHHTASGVALVGGGSTPRPGEISLAHNGVLFLDELPEFDRRVLEVLREPLESGHITISRAAMQADYPAAFQLICAMNPCPCGYHGDPRRACRCTIEQVLRYRGKVSGPLLDRIDLQLEVEAVSPAELRANAPRDSETSEQVRERVIRTREIQWQRQGYANHALNSRDMERFCQPDAGGMELLEQAMERLALSARAYHRILRLARTIADMAEEKSVSLAHVSEAIGYRTLDRQAP